MISQGKSLSQIPNLHQETLPELNPSTYQYMTQLDNLQKNLHQLFITPQNILSQCKHPKIALYTYVWSATRRSYLTSCFYTNCPISHWISNKITISDTIWQPNDGAYLRSTIYTKSLYKWISTPPLAKKTKKEFTHIIYPTQDLSDLSSPLTLDPTSSNFVLPSAIKSTVYPIVLLSTVP